MTLCCGMVTTIPIIIPLTTPHPSPQVSAASATQAAALSSQSTALNAALSQTASTLQTSINTNTGAIQQSITSDRSTMTFLLSDMATNNDVLTAQQELYAYATNYTNTRV